VAFVTTLSAAATAVKAIRKVKEGGVTVKSIQEYLKENELLMRLRESSNEF